MIVKTTSLLPDYLQELIQFVPADLPELILQDINEFEVQLDAAEDTEAKKKITQKIQKRNQKHEQYQQIREEL